MKKTDKVPKGRLGAWLLSAVLIAILVAAALLLNRPDPDAEATAAQKRVFCVAEVKEILSDNAEEDDWTEGRRIGQQILLLEVVSGEHKGKVFQGSNYLSAYSNVDCRVGSRVIMRLDYDDEGSLRVTSIPNYDRGIYVLIFALVFAAVLVIVGGKKGAAALLGLVYTLLAIWFLLIPMILRGMEPILAGVLIVALTTAASIIPLAGLSKKALCAILGCVGGVVTAGAFAWIFSAATPINGFDMSEAEELVLRSGDYGLHISGLLISGILIASLGAVMDVAMSISSACSELAELNPDISRAQLLRSGMNIGRDAMGTMANTLILAFAGSGLNMLILFRVFDYPLIQVINADAMVIEFIQGIAGSVGIILTVPLVAFISSRLMKKK